MHSSSSKDSLLHSADPDLEAPVARALRAAIQERESKATDVPTEPSPSTRTQSDWQVWPPRDQEPYHLRATSHCLAHRRVHKYVLIDTVSSFVNRQVCFGFGVKFSCFLGEE